MEMLVKNELDFFYSTKVNSQRPDLSVNNQNPFMNQEEGLKCDE